MRKTFYTAITVLVLFVLAGCGGVTNAPQPGNIPATALAKALPSLDTLRSASVNATLVRFGDDAELMSADAVINGQSLQLNSAAGGISWGIWHFNAVGQVQAANVFLSSASTEGVYLGVSDYDRNTWSFSGPAAVNGNPIALASGNFSSVSGDLYIVVLSYDGAAAEVFDIQLTMDVPGGAQTIAPSGGNTSMAVVEGNPAIAYVEAGTGGLKFVRALDAFGASWGSPVPLDPGIMVTSVSMSLINGAPAVAYYNDTDGELGLVTSQDASGATWNSPMTLDGAGAPDVGEYCSLRGDVNDTPAISYYGFDGGDLYYIRATNGAGTTWTSPVAVDTDGNTGFYTSLAMVNFKPAIAYRCGAPAQLRYVQAADAFGDSWGTPVNVYTANNPGFSASLLVVDARPAIACYDLSLHGLLYVRANDADGATWPGPMQLDGIESDIGDYCSLALIGGIPAISYHSGLFGDLRYIKSSSADGSIWGTPQLLDESSVIVGKFTSLVEVAGYAGISYYDQTNGTLRYYWGAE